MMKQLSNITYRRVQYTYQSERATRRKAKGQPPKLSDSDFDNIITFITASKANRRLSYNKVIKRLGLPVSKGVLCRALKKRGYRRCVALRKPSLSPELKRVRLI